jgi:hypothetical protein
VTAYLELADYLLIAERVLGLPAEVIANFQRIGLAASALAAPSAGFGGIEAYPDFATKAAVLCWHLVKTPASRWQQAVRLPRHHRVRRAQRSHMAASPRRSGGDRSGNPRRRQQRDG